MSSFFLRRYLLILTALTDTLLRDAISLGVDEVILISDRAFAGADTLATSYTLGKTIQKQIKDFDLLRSSSG